jgi:hypothetical protein
MMDQWQQDPSKPPGGWRGASALSVLMIIAGSVLLLPGICAVAIRSFVGGTDGAMSAIAISGGGILLIVIALQIRANLPK